MEERQTELCLIVKGRGGEGGGGNGVFHGTASAIQYHLWVKGRLLLGEDWTESPSTSVAALCVHSVTRAEKFTCPNPLQKVFSAHNLSQGELDRIPKYVDIPGHRQPRKLFTLISAPDDLTA